MSDIFSNDLSNTYLSLSIVCMVALICSETLAWSKCGKIIFSSKKSILLKPNFFF